MEDTNSVIDMTVEESEKPAPKTRGAKPKLTNEQRLEIWRRYNVGGEKQGALAKEFGVSKGLVYRVFKDPTFSNGIVAEA